jgi:lysophospholipase L1-like esterase
MIRADAYYRPDVVLVVGASNTGGYGSPTSSWPLYQSADSSALYACSWDPTWGPMRPLHAGLGGIIYTISHELRCRGWTPAVAQYLAGGTHSNWWLANMTTVCSYLAGKLAALEQPRLRALYIDSGTSDAIDGPGDTFRANWETVIAAIRAAVSAPELPIVLANTPMNYDGINGMIATYRQIVRDQKAALVAADAYATLVDHGSPVYTDTAHYDYASYVYAGKAVARAMY